LDGGNWLDLLAKVIKLDLVWDRGQPLIGCWWTFGTNFKLLLNFCTQPLIGCFKSATSRAGLRSGLDLRMEGTILLAKEYDFGSISNYLPKKSGLRPEDPFAETDDGVWMEENLGGVNWRRRARFCRVGYSENGGCKPRNETDKSLSQHTRIDQAPTTLNGKHKTNPDNIW